MMVDGAAQAEVARAKINLFLHVLGRRPEGYHALRMMVVFPRIGDLVTAEPADGLSLSVSGPFGDGLSAGADNLTLGAAEALAAKIGGAPGRRCIWKRTCPSPPGSAADRPMLALHCGCLLGCGRDLITPTCTTSPSPSALMRRCAWRRRLR